MKKLLKMIFILTIGSIAWVLASCSTTADYAVSPSDRSYWGGYGYYRHSHRHYRPPPPRAVRRGPRPGRR